MTDIALKTRVMLWGRAAGRCAFPECKKDLVHDATETDDESLIGDIAHIVAESPEGPRGQSPLTPEERAKYANLVLMCKNHHKVIDDQFLEWTAERLIALKAAHETGIRDRLSETDVRRISENVMYATIVDDWVDRVDLTHWEQWTSWFLGADGPAQAVEATERLRGTVPWLLNRVWPGTNEPLEHAFLNFRNVLNDLLALFNTYAEKHPDDMYHTKRFYRISEWNPELYHELANRYEYHVELVGDLVLELTRAGNLVCDVVRGSLEPSFMMAEGVLLVTSGPYEDLRYRTYRVEYRDAERTEQPYPGLTRFETVRFARDRTLASRPPAQPPNDA